MAHADEVRRLRVQANADTPDQARNARERGAEDRPVPDRARVPGRGARGLGPPDDLRRDRGGGGDLRRTRAAPARTSWGSSARWTGSPSRSACWIRRSTSSCPTRSAWRSRCSRSRRGRRGPETLAAEGERAARGQPDAGAPRRAPGDREARPVRDAGPRDLRGRRGGDGLDPKVEVIPLVATLPKLQQMRIELGASLRTRSAMRAVARRVGHDDRLPRAAAARRHRGVRRLLLLRDERPHTDRVQVLARRHRQVRRNARSGSSCRRTRSSRSTSTASVPGNAEVAAEEGRAAADSLHLGICGEHGGDPASVVFCHEIRLDA